MLNKPKIHCVKRMYMFRYTNTFYWKLTISKIQFCFHYQKWIIFLAESCFVDTRMDFANQLLFPPILEVELNLFIVLFSLLITLKLK